MKPVRLIAPTFPPAAAIAEDYASIVQAGIFTNGGPFERRFAAALADLIGGNVGVSVVSNATAALELSIQALVGRGTGMKILVPSFTFAAGPLAVKRAGLTPLFIDIDRTTWQPSLEDASMALDQYAGVAGVLLTSTFGVANPEIAQWEDLAQTRGLSLIVDSAAGLGSQYPWGEVMGARGNCEIFSLHATKTMAIGEGGAVVARNPHLVAAIEQLKNFGFDKNRQSATVGTNAKLDELSSAIGLRQVAELPGRLVARQAVLARYQSELEPLGITFQPGADRAAIPFVSALAPTEASRDRFVETLTDGLVECRTYYNPPVHRHSTFAERGEARPLPVTDEIAARIISLPMADNLEVEALRRIADAAVAAFGALP